MAAGNKRARATALAAAAVVVVMVGASFAAVPLYRIFCQVTGFGGTPRVAAGEAAPAQGTRTVTVSLFGNVNAGLPWTFAPGRDAVTLRVGESALVHYRATNRGTRATTGVATFNVTPFKAGPYFVKVACFCFDEQVLAPGESVDMPVTFYVDPAIAEDPALADVRHIALSYTFFRRPSGRRQEAGTAGAGETADGY